MGEWFDNADFWERLEPFFFSKLRTPQDTIREVEGVIKLLHLTGRERILDLGCGIGRHALPLARRGFRMTGVDLTTAYLKKAGQQAKMEGLHIEFIKEDMRRFRRVNGFDVILSLFSTFGYFSDPHHDIKTLENVKASLSPGGVYMIDLMGREVLKKHIRDKTDFRDDKTGAYLVQEFSVDHRWEWVEMKWTVVLGQKQRTYKFGIRIFSETEVKEVLTRVGFKHLHAFGNFKGEPYNDKAERLIVMAR